MKIYTKTGDKGTSGLIGGTRVAKSDPRLEAYGTVDELNTQVGLLRALLNDGENRQFLAKIQNLLFTVGSNLATDLTKTNVKTASVMKDEYITAIEQEIDRLVQKLPPLSQFILPGGSQKAAQSHVCRTVARRAERRIVQLTEIHTVDSLVIIYVNRLSDYFFTLARIMLMEDKIEEIPWERPQ